MGRSFTPAGGAGTPLEGQELLAAFVAPPLQSSVNDYRVAVRGFDNASLLSVSATTAVNITGLQGATPNRQLVLLNTGANAITLKNASGASAAANRFQLGGADVILNQNQAVPLVALAAGGWAIASPPPPAPAPPGANFSGANYGPAAGQSVATATSTAIILAAGAVQYDIGGYFNAANPTRLTAPANGVYLLTGSVAWAVSAAAAFGAGVNFWKNGGETVFYGYQNEAGPVASESIGNALSIPVELVAGDYMELIVFQSSGGNLAVRSDLGFLTHFSMTQLH
jgi:hypothetical protein